LRDAGYTVAAGYGGDDERVREFTAITGIGAWKWDVGDYDSCLDAVGK
jgi:acetoacetyl-CoA reductase